MRKQLLGIGLILLGIMFAILVKTFDIWIPFIDRGDILWGVLSFISGVSGIIVILRNMKD